MPSRVVTRPSDMLKRQTYQFQMSVADERLCDRCPGCDHAVSQSPGLFVREHLPRQFRVTQIADRSRIQESAVALEELDHRPALLTVCRIQRCARVGVLALKVRSMREEHLRHLEFVQSDAVM